jgi:hypothetical protein
VHDGTPTVTGTPSPGWYADPTGTHQQRYVALGLAALNVLQTLLGMF